jgi:hypothetical protein
LAWLARVHRKAREASMYVKEQNATVCSRCYLCRVKDGGSEVLGMNSPV